MTGDEKSQTPLSGFGGLEGIDEARNVRTRDPTILNRLVDLGTSLVDKHSKHMPEPDNLDELESMDGFYTNIYNEVMLALSSSEAPSEFKSGVNFDEKDIAEFIIANSNHDLARKQAQVLGIYSGCLAQILTERNALQGKRTVIHLDGRINNKLNNKLSDKLNDDLSNRIKFDYLFYFARVLDTVILENFDGEEILAHAASFGGRADTLVCSGINGYSCLMSVGNYNGRVNKAIAINIEGIGTLMNSGDNNGYVSQAIGINLRGDASLSGCASDYGVVEQIIGVGITDGGDSLSEICCIEDCADVVNQIFAVDVNGGGTLRTTGNEKSRINEVIYDGIVGSDFTEYQKSNGIRCRELIAGEQVRATHSPHDAERIETTIALIRSLKDKPYQEVIKIAEQIYALRPVFPFEYFKGAGK